MKFQWWNRDSHHVCAARAFMLMKCGVESEEEAVHKAINAKESDGSCTFCENPELIPDSQVELVLQKLRGMRETAARHIVDGREKWVQTYGRRRTGSSSEAG